MATENFKQRKFPWIQGVAAPASEDRRAVASCQDRAHAARSSLSAKPGGPWTDSWLAGRLGISRGYMSRVLSGKQELPDWMITPICYATGSLLLQQYVDLLEPQCEVEMVAAMIRRQPQAWAVAA